MDGRLDLLSLRCVASAPRLCRASVANPARTRRVAGANLPRRWRMAAAYRAHGCRVGAASQARRGRVPGANLPLPPENPLSR